MRRNSAFLRLTIGLSLVFVVTNVVILAAVFWLVAQHLDMRMKMLVSSDITGLADLYAQRRLPALREAIATRLARSEVSDAAYLLLDKSGGVLAGNLVAWPDDISGNGDWSVFHAAITGKPTADFIGVGATLPGGFKLAVGHSIADNQAILRQLLVILVGTGVVTLIIGFGGGALISRWLVERVVAVNRVAGAVRDGNLAARVPGAERNDEFGELAANFNAMLGRVERLVIGLREVSDRIAHELRTPLTRLRSRITKLETAAPGSEEANAALDAISREIGTTVAIFDALLDIATTEAEAGDTSHLKTVDLAEVAANVVDLYEAVAEERGIALKATIGGPAEMLGDGNLLARMLANVIDNAIKFSPEGGTVAVMLARNGSSHVVSVSDSGPGLAPDIRDRAFERFSRSAATASVPGHGLGLSLVRAIAVRHGIGIRLEDAGPGLSVVFTCPGLRDAA